MTWALLAVLAILLVVLLVAHRRGEFILWRPRFFSVTGVQGTRMSWPVSADGAVRDRRASRYSFT
jgi:O-antigen/teichoic acid export membrane protein